MGRKLDKTVFLLDLFQHYSLFEKRVDIIFSNLNYIVLFKNQIVTIWKSIVTIWKSSPNGNIVNVFAYNIEIGMTLENSLGCFCILVGKFINTSKRHHNI